MRLTQIQRDQIFSVFKSRLEFEEKLYLFGSRTREDRRGGDIDLLLVTERIDFFRSQKIQLLDEILKSLGEERKVDLVFANQNLLESDPFIRSIFSDAISLS